MAHACNLPQLPKLHNEPQADLVQELWELQLSAIAAATGAAVPVPVGIAFLLRRSPASFQDCNIPSAVLDLLRVSYNSGRRFWSCSWCNLLHH